MAVSQIYAIVLLGAIVIPILFHAILRLYLSTFWLLKLWVLRYLRCPSIVRRHRLVPRLTRLDLLISLTFFVVIAILNSVNLHSKKDATTRTGLLCVVTLVPLFASTQLSFVADLIGVNLVQIHRLHRAFGAAALIEGLAHIVLAIRSISVQNQVGLFGIIAAISLVVSFVLPIIRRYAHELFLLLHVSVAVLLGSSLWMHLVNSRSKYCMAVAGLLLSTSTFFRFLRILFKNASLSSPHGSKFTMLTADVHKDDLIKIDITLPRQWKIRPGQYVYVQLPILTSNSWMQSHPFMIVSWSETFHDASDTTTTNLELVVKSRSGWTNYVLRALIGPVRANVVTSFVDGPYGGRKDLGEYSTVLMMATGIGIFAHIPYIQGLFDGYERSCIRTRRIKVFWQIENEDDTAWAFKWMQKFLERDDIRDEDGQATFLHISLFVPHDNASSRVSTQGKRLGRRVEMLQKAIDARVIFKSEVTSRDMEREPKVILSLSGEYWLRDSMRKAIAQATSEETACLKGVDLLETDFQPAEAGKRREFG